MRKIIILAILCCVSLGQLWSQRQWDRPMQLKNCTIDIKADNFTATTFIEFEFCNPNKQEIEGLFRFALKPGQIITAFQLDLNGKYRDGSIEEKWKATNAYNSIVGKRIDPALLTMEYADHYSLRIYPVPANGCRKVTMTIQQALKADKNELLYSLPLDINDTVRHFKLNIAVNGLKPAVRPGLISTQYFTGQNQFHNLSWTTDNILLKKELAFSIPVSAAAFCTKTLQDTKHFALRFQPSLTKEYELHPKKLAVFWDASASTAKRDLKREISFLKQFISYHNVAELVIIPFNSKLLDKAVFYTGNYFNSRWDQYLENISYDGATQLGSIDLAGMSSDLYMLFTDGNNTYGKSVPKTGTSIVHCVYTSAAANSEALQQITGASGGKVINLNKSSISAAIASASKAETWLVKISSSSGKVIIEQSLPVKRNSELLINGTMAEASDILYFHYGSNNNINYVERMVLDAGAECPYSAIDRLTMLNNYDWITKKYQWSSIIDFGLAEKVVTQNTAYIVLERIEDYVTYNITPPKELEEACEKINYVRRDTRADRVRMQEMSEFNIIRNVATVYNSRIRSLVPQGTLIELTRDKFDAETRKTVSNEPTAVPDVAISDSKMKFDDIGMGDANSMSEVVVTSVGMSRQYKSIGYSTTVVRSQDILPSATSVEQVLQGRVSGLQVTTGYTGNSGTISLRGMSSLNRNAQPLYVLDGVPVSGNINDLINVHDIENISVLKDASATAMYGSRAFNGAIVINSKKGRNFQNIYNSRPYRLKDMEDVEYLEELKDLPVSGKIAGYEKLREEYGGAAGFYFDVAQHLFESGLSNDAFRILLNAAEAANGSQQVLIAIAYTLEKWKKYDEAIVIYEQLILDNPHNLKFYQDLAWLQYQKGNYQQAVDLLYGAIKMNTGQLEGSNLYIKSTLLNEMNIIISMHKDKLDIRNIPASIIQPLAVDLRIMMECNRGYVNFSIKEPGNEISSYSNMRTKNGGIFINNYYWYTQSPAEYQIKTAREGKYRVSVNYYDSRASDGIPTMIRIKTFKNFGRANQSISIENVIMDNQNGNVEIAEIHW